MVGHFVIRGYYNAAQPTYILLAFFTCHLCLGCCCLLLVVFRMPSSPVSCVYDVVYTCWSCIGCCIRLPVVFMMSSSPAGCVLDVVGLAAASVSQMLMLEGKGSNVCSAVRLHNCSAVRLLPLGGRPECLLEAKQCQRFKCSAVHQPRSIFQISVERLIKPIAISPGVPEKAGPRYKM